MPTSDESSSLSRSSTNTTKPRPWFHSFAWSDGWRPRSRTDQPHTTTQPDGDYLTPGWRLAAAGHPPNVRAHHDAPPRRPASSIKTSKPRLDPAGISQFAGLFVLHQPVEANIFARVRMASLLAGHPHTTNRVDSNIRRPLGIPPSRRAAGRRVSPCPPTWAAQKAGQPPRLTQPSTR